MVDILNAIASLFFYSLIVLGGLFLLAMTIFTGFVLFL